MIPFREWYEQRYGQYPGDVGEEWSSIMLRLADAFAEYVDEVVAEIRKENGR